MQAVARGADGVMFFQWRQSRAGAEKFHSAMVPHGPAESSPVWREVKQLGNELKGLDAVCGSHVHADVAIALDWESWWALELPSKPSTRIKQIDMLEDYYRPLFAANVVPDFARPEHDLSGYKLVLVPNLYLVGDEGAHNLSEFVRGGGTLVMSFFSGIVDPFEHIRLGGYPAPFRRLLGLNVVDWLPLGDGEGVGLEFGDRTPGRGDQWTEIIELAGADAVATFGGGRLAGRPAITRHKFGSGLAIYAGTRLDQVTMARVVRSALGDAEIEATDDVPAGVEVVRRHVGPRSIAFFLNHREVAVDVPVTNAGLNLVNGAQVHPGLMRIGPFGAAVIREGW
jgi:beta-galactosidase